MAHALRLAARGLGRCWPNPAVGCVIVENGRILGRGTTGPGGRPHAERIALAQAGAAARGATAYVTLEPCAHHGQTSPCATALAAAGVARVVTAITDPDPRVAGGGHAILRRAGIAVTEGVLEDQAARVTQGFLKRVTRGLPFVTLKLAASLDARTAMASGESRWITGAEARAHVHLLRLTHDAVLVGGATARADDPDLTVRHLGATPQPLRLVLDSRLGHSPDSRLGRSASSHPVWLLHTEAAPDSQRRAWEAAGARLLPCPATAAGRIDLPAAFRLLAQEGLTRILVEAGPTLAAALVAEGLADDLALYSAGRLLGGEARPLLGPLGMNTLADTPRLNLRETRQVGADQFSLWSF
jgi:diaminohydroxyphosphoribosylaminopyrimidine deaminase/5-amino-6-(5-phosphoribosylamino)uracil reductase